MNVVLGYIKSKYKIADSDVNIYGHFHAGRIGSLIDSISSHSMFLHGDGYAAGQAQILTIFSLQLWPDNCPLNVTIVVVCSKNTACLTKLLNHLCTL